ADITGICDDRDRALNRAAGIVAAVGPIAGRHGAPGLGRPATDRARAPGRGKDPVAPVQSQMMSTINAAVDILREGRLVAFPTETVYGLGADATNAQAVARIFSVKGRP